MDALYLVIFVDAIVVKVRGRVGPQHPCFYVVMGLTINGEREILGIWAGEGAERGEVLVGRCSPSWENQGRRGCPDRCL